MDSLKLTQLSISELKLDEAEDFCLNSYDNSLTVVGSSIDFYILELLQRASNNISCPFKVKYVEIPKEQPFKKLLHDIDFTDIYANCNVQESQELALDPIYVAECSLDAPKPRIVAIRRLPRQNKQLWTVLTTYGVCELMQQEDVTEEYQVVRSNLSSMLITDVFPPPKSPCNFTTFPALRNYVNKYLITSFCWDSVEPIIYLGTAAGYVVALQYNHVEQNFHKYHYEHVESKGRISFLYNFNDFLLVADHQGVVQLMKISRKMKTFNVSECLWSRPDRMACRKAFITYVQQYASYLVLFCKAAHIMAYSVNTEGTLLAASTLYLSGIKITGLECVNDTEFITTTITGRVKLIRVQFASASKEIKLLEKEIHHEFDIKNFQILGICATKTRCLWSFLLYRNKEYTHHSKYNNNSAFLSVCKLNDKDRLSDFDEKNIKAMDEVLDMVVNITLDIFTNPPNIYDYNSFCDLAQLVLPANLNDSFLQKLQMKLIIVQTQGRHQQIKYKICKRQTATETEFLELIIQLIQILFRLHYLYKLQSKQSGDALSNFQQLSIACMLKKWELLMTTLKSSKADDNPLNSCIDSFVTLLTQEMSLNSPWNIETLHYAEEKCHICSDIIPMSTFTICTQMHAITRCSISQVQLPLFHKRYCPQCYALAMPDDCYDLQELFPKAELVKCLFCRFSLKQDDL